MSPPFKTQHPFLITFHPNCSDIYFHVGETNMEPNSVIYFSVRSALCCHAFGKPDLLQLPNMLEASQQLKINPSNGTLCFEPP